MENKKILIVGPAWIGDMVMAQSLFMLLKAKNPTTTIDVIAPDWSRPLLARMPEVNRAIPLPIGHRRLKLFKRYRIARKLRKEHYHQAIVLPNSFKSALIPYWAKIPIRTGWRGEHRSYLLNDIRFLDEDRFPLMVERFLALGLSTCEPLTRPYFQPKLQLDQNHVTQTLLQCHVKLTGQSILALCPGAEYGPAKRWPEAYFAQVAEEFLRLGWQVWLFGGVKDQIYSQKIMQLTQQRCLDFTGKVNLIHAIDLLSVVDKVLCNDSGLMHMVSALNRPAVVIYGSSSPRFTPPLSRQAKILKLDLPCSPCFKRTCPYGHFKCLKDLHSDQVIKALLL